MKNILIRFRLFALVWIYMIIFQTCTQEEDLIMPDPEPETVSFPNVDEALYEYFSRFEEEASLRDLSYNLADLGITAKIEEIDEEHVAGQCAYNRFLNPRRITIDKAFWESSSGSFKEFIVFHELGHCILNRSHLETSFSNGACSSIMRSGNGECFDYYNRLTREYYIDELFEIESPEPF